MAEPTITVVEHQLPACVFCGAPLRKAQSLAAGACCHCRHACHVPDYYVDLTEVTGWAVSA